MPSLRRTQAQKDHVLARLLSVSDSEFNSDSLPASIMIKIKIRKKLLVGPNGHKIRNIVIEDRIRTFTITIQQQIAT